MTASSWELYLTRSSFLGILVTSAMKKGDVTILSGTVFNL